MEIRGRWTSFRASGVYTAAPLAFNWRARFPILPGIWLVAEDGHRAGHGWGGARLWGKLSLGKRTDAVFCSARCRVKARRDADRLQRAMWLAAQAIAAREKRDVARRRERYRGQSRATHAVRERDRRERIEAREQAALGRLMSSLETEG